jgi:hypothetical protein
MASRTKSEKPTASKNGSRKQRLTLDDVIDAYNVIVDDHSPIGRLPNTTLDAIEKLLDAFSAPEFPPVNIDFRTTSRKQDADVRTVSLFMKISPDLVARLVAELRLARQKPGQKGRLQTT